tara:strand:+ start:161 stop:931 length:771 start_codon:yes stop_codon:yes gene_type:complete
MKAVILAGGKGTRISEETYLKPKPMVEIGGKPILWHILKIYSSYNINDFIICCGYKGYLIKEYFSNYFLHMSDVTFDLSNNSMLVHYKKSEPWKITLVDTGEDSETGGRLKRVKKYLDNDIFAFTYGDGLSNVNIQSVIQQHIKSKKLATVTAVRPPGRYGALGIREESEVSFFFEKPEGEKSWINGGFFILQSEIFKYINGDSCSWEVDCLPKLVNDGELHAFKHEGFWQPMDTLRDKKKLDNLWNSGKAPWHKW